MPKTRNYSEREKRDAMDLLDIHDDIYAVHLLTGIHQRTLRRWRKKLRRQQKATLSEKSFSLSDKETMSDNPQTKQKLSDNLTPTPDSAIQPLPDTQVALTDPDKARGDLQKLYYIRERLLIFARDLARGLDADDPDINRRTMALSRTLERIRWLDENLYDSEDEGAPSEQALPPNRIAFVYEEQAGEYPPWHDASQEDGD